MNTRYRRRERYDDQIERMAEHTEYFCKRGRNGRHKPAFEDTNALA